MTNFSLDNQFSTEDYYRALFENPKKNCVLLMDKGGVILDVNRAFVLSFGYDTNDVIGEHFSLLFTDEDRAKDLPMREVRTVLEEGQSFDNNYLVNKNNVRTWVSGESLLITKKNGQPCILKIIQNIHVQKESEYSIISLNNLNENILSTIDDGVLVLDQEGKIVKANRGFYRAVGLPESSIRHEDISKLFERFDKKKELGVAIDTALGDGHCKPPFELDFEDGYGRPRAAEVWCTRIENQYGEFNVLIVFHDITSRRVQERQREDILNFVAHELRNPLTNIILNIDWMKAQLIEERRDGYLEFIERSERNAQRLKKLVNELYNSTKLVSGSYEVQLAPCVLSDCLTECIEAAQKAYPDFQIEQHPVPVVKVLADKDKVMQVLNNYLSNAIKYSGEDRHIYVEASVVDGFATISVTDHGKGIPLKELPFVFNRFYRAEKTRDVEGLGIGLFLSRQIIEAHHARVWVESKEGKGSTFYFSLPVVK